jgi:hypothetical protein
MENAARAGPGTGAHVTTAASHASRPNYTAMLDPIRAIRVGVFDNESHLQKAMI